MIGPCMSESAREPAARALALAGRNTDLMILRPEPVDEPEARRFYSPGEVLLALGRPGLIAPCAGDCPAPGRHAVIAWNGSRESARAVHDALPLRWLAQRWFCSVSSCS